MPPVSAVMVTRWAAAAALVVVLPLAGALVGARSGRPIRLDLGPGDGPYVSGFIPAYEIDDKVATHWTTYSAAVRLPLRVDGPVDVGYRFARVFPQTAVVEMGALGGPVDRFEARGGLFVERRAPLGSATQDLELRIRADSHERQDRGLKVDWVEWRPGAGARVRLRAPALWTPVLTVLLVLLLHLALGWAWREAALLATPWSLLLTAALLVDPWLVHRLLRGIPVSLCLFGTLGVVVARWRLRSGHASVVGVRTVGALAVAAFLLRALAVNHPQFYYPDLRTHARLVQTVEAAGLDFFVHPAQYIWEHGVWRTEAYGKTYAFPYSPAFHLPFAALGLSYDGLITAMKLTAAALTVVPIAVVYAVAGRAGLSTVGAILMLLVPTYTSRLSFSFMPSLFGHAVDMLFFLWLSLHLPRIRTPRVWLLGTLLVAACQLAYVSGVTNMSLFVAVLAVAAGWTLRKAGTRFDGGLGAGILALGLAGSALSVALYYRDFLDMALDVASRIGGPARAASRYPVRGFFEVALSRTWDFFGIVYPALAAAGLVRLFRARDEQAPPVRALAAAWLGTYFLLLLGRARIPDIFLHGHETLLVTPLVCLAAGEALSWLWRTGWPGRLAAAGLLAFLAAQGARLQWQFLVDQLGNAL